MGKIVISGPQNASLDGVVQDPDGEEGFRLGGWFVEFGGKDLEEWNKLALEDALGAEAWLLGRGSYEFFGVRWRPRSGELADRLNSSAAAIAKMCKKKHRQSARSLTPRLAPRAPEPGIRRSAPTIPRTLHPTPAERHGTLPGHTRVPAAATGHPTKQAIGRSDGRGRHQGAAGGRSSLRSPDAALEPAHAPLHLWRAGRDSHHRSPPDGATAEAGDRVRHRGRGEGRGGPLRRDQEAGPGLDPGVGRALPDAVREPALARRPAHQLQHDPQADPAAARAARVQGGRPARPAAHQGAHVDGGRAAQARVQPRRRRRHAAHPGRGDHHRPEDRGDRAARGRAPRDPDHRPGRLQLRPGPRQLRDPRQRRRNPLLRADHRRAGLLDRGRRGDVARSEEKRRAEEEERKRREEEERKRREAEEKAKQEAEEKAKAEAEAKAKAERKPRSRPRRSRPRPSKRGRARRFPSRSPRAPQPPHDAQGLDAEANREAAIEVPQPPPAEEAEPAPEPAPTQTGGES